MRVVNTYNISHLSKTPEKCLHEADMAKEKMYLDACLQKCQHFSPFVASVDGILGVEAGSILKIIASRLTKKWQQLKSRMCGYIKGRISITLVRATHQCIRGSRVLAHRISVQGLQWEGGSGLNLFQ